MTLPVAGLAPADTLHPPSEAVRLALADARTLPPDQQRQARYLWLGNEPESERAGLARALAGHANGASTQPEIVRPATAASEQHPDGTHSPLLLRASLADYGWRRETWEKLQDPLFAVQVERVKEVPWGYYDAYGRWVQTKVERKTVKERAFAPWLGEKPEQQQALLELAALTQSQAPVVGGRWFLNQTAVQEGRAVGYYDLLGIKDQKDFERLVRFDRALAKDLEHRRVVVFSGITLQPRRVERTATVLGGLYRTFDNSAAQDRNNPLRVLDDDFRFEATEQFAAGPNGMPLWYLGNAQGQRQDKAPDNVVGGDRLGRGNDTRLHVNLSCIRCHVGVAPHEAGVKDLDAIQPRRIDAATYDKLLELRRLYQRDMGRGIRQDRETYAAAIKEATGWEPQEYGQQYGRAFDRYEFARVDLAWAARDLGLPEERLRAAFRRADEKPFALDPVLSVLLGGAIPIRQWEEALPLAWKTWKEFGP